MESTRIMIGILIGIAAVALLILIIQLFKLKIWVAVKNKRNNNKLTTVGFMNPKGEDEVPEVHLPDKARGTAIGRIRMDENNGEDAYVEILLTDPDDESEKPKYHTYGFINQEGIIYRVTEKNKKPEMIGYTARPSDPTTPTSIGERTWQTLWLKCTLNAYLGAPPEKPEAESAEESNTDKKKDVAVNNQLFVAHGLDSIEKESEESKENLSGNESEKGSGENSYEKEDIGADTFENKEELENEELPNDVDPGLNNLDDSKETDSEEIGPEEDSYSVKQSDEFELSEEELVLPESKNDSESETPEELEETDKDSDEETEAEVPEKIAEESKEEESEDKAEEDKKGKKEKKDKKDKKRENLNKKIGPRPVAVASYVGIHSSRKDYMPPEARGAAFGLFYNLYNKKNLQEHYGSPAYGWKDTALLTGFIYTVLYCIWYIFEVKVLGFRFIGYRWWQIFPLYFAFFALWIIVRAVKIEFIERSDTIQPKLDLFNKTLGQKAFDIVIIICCIFTLAFSPKYYRFNFIPLSAVLITAIAVNLSLRSSKKPWKTINPFASDKDEEGDSDELENPRGDIERLYQWELETNKNLTGQLPLYFNARYISDLRFNNPFFSQRKDKPTTSLVYEMFQYMNSHKDISARSRYVAKRIKEIARKHGMTEEDTLQFVLDFVQEPNIRFVMNRNSEAIQKYEEYVRFPDETLYDKEGDSNSKAFLAAVLLYYLGINVVFLNSRMQHHGAIGIEVARSWIHDRYIFGRKIEEVTFQHNGRMYVFCETTADGFPIGGTLNGMKPDDFDERVEFLVNENEVDVSNEGTHTRLYHWELDSEKGNKLDGQYTFEFNPEELERLRKANPFRHYGEDGKTYEENVKSMFAYLDREPGRKRKVKELAAYIRKSAREAGLDSLDTAQFALDFCQMPNIIYKIDEESTGIDYCEVSKEYMRYPDEVLYDKEGDCDCKSSLTVALFRELGYKTLFMMSEKYGHAAVGLEYDPAWKNIIGIEDESKVIRHHNGIDYIYCETTGDGYRVGHIKEDQSVQEFETVVEL